MEGNKESKRFLWGMGLLVVMGIYFCSTAVTLAQDATPASRAHSGPRVGLVLGGGGARGFAHLGVIRVLEEMRIPIHCIAGTSMGSIVGALYASGMSPDEIEAATSKVDWAAAFKDIPPREDRSFRRKRDDDLRFVKNKPGFSDGEIKLPTGFIQGQKLGLIFEDLTLHVSEVHDFDDLRIPYRAVATDIVTGDPVVLGSGNLARAMRASMSVPGAFSFMEIDGKMLVDGGVSNNVPVDVARAMGADVLVVVAVGTPLKKRDEIKSALSVAGQLTGLMTVKNTEAQLATLTDKDTLIVPDLGDVTSGSFDRSVDAAAAGLAAANLKKTELSRLSLSEADYAAYRSGLKAPGPRPPVIHFVRLENQSRLGDDVIRAYLHVKVGEPLDVDALEADIGHIYGLELFENVWYEIVEEEGETGLVVFARERSWGPNYLQLGLTIANDFDGDSSFNASLSYLRTAINSLGGEWRTILQIGEEPYLYTEIFQPLDIRNRYFIAPRLLVGRQNFNIYESGDRIAEYRVTRYGIEIAGGRQFGTWGEGRIGYRREAGDAEVRVGPPSLPDIDFDVGEAFLRLSLDELDNVNFPRSGAYSILEWTASREGLGADTSFDQVMLNSFGAKTWGRNTLAGGIRFNTTLDSDAPIQSRFRIGGFLNLSGFNPDELSGQHEGLARLIYYRRLGNFNLMPSYLGLSFEVGNVWEDDDEIKLDNTLVAGSAFLGVDTVLGPIYLGYGHAEHGNSSVYLYLGRVF